MAGVKSKILTTVKWTARVLVVATAVLLVASAWGGSVHPSHGWFFPMLTLALPFLLALNVLIILAVAMARRWRWLTVTAVALLVAWPMARNITPLNVVSATTSADAGADSLRFTVLTYNVATFGRFDQTCSIPNRSFRLILDTDADFVLVQEGSPERDYMALAQLSTMMDEFKSKYPYHSDGERDLLLFSKYPYTVAPDVEVRPVAGSVNNVGYSYHYYAKTFDIKLPNRHQLRLINLHLQSMGLTPTDKLHYTELLHGELPRDDNTTAVTHSIFEKLGNAFKQRAVEAVTIRRLLDESPDNVVVCGDFNDTPASYTYRTIKGRDMTDAWTKCALGPTFTFRDNLMYFKIDQVLYRGDLDATAITRLTGGESDHYPLLTTFTFHP